MQGLVKVRWKEGGRHKHGTADLDARLVLDGEVWVPVKADRTGERVEFPAWQLEYAASGPRGGKRWSPLVALAFEPVEELSGSARWVQPGLFGEAA